MTTIRHRGALVLVLIPILLLSLVGCGGGGGQPNSPPTVTITAGASGDTTDTMPTFTWSGSDTDGSVVGYEYKLDSANWTAVSSGVTSHTFDALSPGTYTFSVRAKDDDGDHSQTASRSFTIIENTGDVPIVID